jgi:hypothetical protein
VVSQVRAYDVGQAVAVECKAYVGFDSSLIRAAIYLVVSEIPLGQWYAAP